MTNAKHRKAATHTPAPWNYTPYPESSGFIIGAKGLRSVAVTTEKSLDCLRDENEANARLIAAAPELLESVEDLICAYESGFKFEDAGRALHKARAAIAKAKGE